MLHAKRLTNRLFDSQGSLLPSAQQLFEQIDKLIAASQQFKEQLIEAGFSQAHEWMFNIRKILYDLQRMSKLSANLFNTTDVDKTPLLLNNFVGHIRGGFSLHCCTPCSTAFD